MHANSMGKLFSFTSFGESHGPAVGCVVDGCPPRITLAESDIQPWLDKRRPGVSPYVSPRKEEDRVRIMSGVCQGQTTGHPLLLLVENHDQRSGDYQPIHDVFRPGHADFTYAMKYGIRDPRGGGRSSARETVARVAAGAVARKVLAAHAATRDLEIRAGLVGLGGVLADVAGWDDAQIAANPFFCPDPRAVEPMRRELDAALAEEDSLGGLVEIRVRNVPVGLGEPLYDKLDARIAHACMGVNAVKGVEIGDGFVVAGVRGGVNNDAMRSPASGNPSDAFVSNHAGGILGGISTGAEIVVRCAVKPTPSIGRLQWTVDTNLENRDIEIGGRHDPAVCIRAVPVLEATLALVLADFLLLSLSRSL